MMKRAPRPWTLEEKVELRAIARHKRAPQGMLKAFAAKWDRNYHGAGHKVREMRSRPHIDPTFAERITAAGIPSQRR